MGSASQTQQTHPQDGNFSTRTGLHNWMNQCGHANRVNRHAQTSHKFILVLILSRGWNPQQLPTPTSVRIALVVRGRRGRSGMDGWVQRTTPRHQNHN